MDGPREGRMNEAKIVAKALMGRAAFIMGLTVLAAAVWVRWGWIGLARGCGAAVLGAVIFAAWRHAARADAELERRFRANNLDFKRGHNANRVAGNLPRADESPVFPSAHPRRPRGAA